MATSQEFADEHDLQMPAKGPAEDSPFELIYLNDRKIKYINHKYKKLNEQMYDQTCDVKLKVCDTFIKGHRKVLADASDYFDAMFKHEMKEKDEFVIELKELSPAGVNAMVEYFYHGHVSIEEGIVPNILQAGRFFHVEWILDICSDYMIRHLSMYDFNLTMELMDTYSLGELRWDIFKFYGHNLPTLIEKESFFKDVCFEFLFHFLMEGMHVDLSEFCLIQVILKWVSFDDSRKEHLVTLLRQIRYPIMDLEELEDLPQEVTDLREIREEIEEAKMYCLNIPMQCLKTDEKYCSRGARPTVMLSMFTEAANTVVYKDPCDEKASLFVENLGSSGLAVDFSTTNQVALGNFMYCAGGYNDDYASSGDVYRYDPRDREWTQFASMSQPRVSFAMASSKDRIYVIGGVNHVAGDGDEIILDSVEMYNPVDNEWKDLLKLPFGIFDLAAAYCRETLYISGGISSDDSLPIPLKNVFSLGEGKDQWSPLPDMLCARQGHSMTEIDDKLYVLGGYTSGQVQGAGFKECPMNEVFDIETKQWTELSPPAAYGHLYRHVCAVYTKIYFLGSEDSEVFFACYDTEKDEYSTPVTVGNGFCRVGLLSIGYPYT